MNYLSVKLYFKLPALQYAAGKTTADNLFVPGSFHPFQFLSFCFILGYFGLFAQHTSRGRRGWQLLQDLPIETQGH
jgi:hypothetical protein